MRECSKYVYFNISIYQYIHIYSETLNNEYIERIRQMSYSSFSDNGILNDYMELFKTVPAIHSYLFIFANTEIYVK